MQGTVSVSSLAPAHLGGPTDPSHDDDLRRGIIRTEISRGVARVVVGVFLFAIASVPLSQSYLEKLAEEDSPLLDLFRRPPTAENLHQLEHDIEVASYAKTYVQPRLQGWLTRFGRVGNKRATIGHDGWLYYTPGVQHVAGPGFLQRDLQSSRRKASLDAGDGAVEPDPLPAIFDFQRALAARGIRLVLFPVPDKAALQPAQLHGRGEPSAVTDNPDTAAFIAQVRQRGVVVFDARAAVPAAPRAPVFLVQDTHYTPAWMEQLAFALAQVVVQLGVLPPPAAPAVLQAAPQTATRVGDLVDMLKLLDDQRQFSPRTVTVHQVQDAQGNPWESDPAADVLLLGDSFTNIFTLEGMGWGAAAGLGPQLSRALGRPLDVIAQNDSGAFATRQALARELAAGNDRLAGKRVVIWQFASRELSNGDWKRLEWPRPIAGAGR